MKLSEKMSAIIGDFINNSGFFIVIVVLLLVSSQNASFYKNISEKAAHFTDIAVNNEGNVFISYKDFAHGNKLSIQSLNKNKWSYVGTPGFTWLDVFHSRIIIDRNNILHAAFLDCGYNDRLTVISRINNRWITEGERGISEGMAENISIAADSNGKLLVAYTDKAYSNRLFLKRFTGTKWESLIQPEDFPQDFGALTDCVKLVIGENDTPYILYIDSSDNYAVHLAKITDSGTSTTRLSSARSEYIGLSAGKDAMLYAIHSEERGNVLSVIKDDAVTKQIVFNNNKAGNYNRITTGPGGIPVIASLDRDSLRLAVYYYTRGKIRKFNYTPGVHGMVSYINMTHDKNNNIYIVFRDHSHNEKAGVLRLDAKRFNI